MWAKVSIPALSTFKNFRLAENDLLHGTFFASKLTTLFFFAYLTLRNWPIFTKFCAGIVSFDSTTT